MHADRVGVSISLCKHKVKQRGSLKRKANFPWQESGQLKQHERCQGEVNPG